MFAGVFSFSRPTTDWGTNSIIFKSLTPYKDSEQGSAWESGSFRLVWQPIDPKAAKIAIYEQPDSGVAAVIWGRLDRQESLAQTLGLPRETRPEPLLVAAWQRWGQDCLLHLDGDFVFAICDPRERTVFLARDVFGTKPLYYRLDENGLVFATTAAVFPALAVGRCTVSREWLARFLLDLSCSHELTAFTEVRKLPAAHSLLVLADGRASLRRYHQFIDDAPPERKRENHWLEAYRAAWQEAVACRMPEHGLIACENSGGLDSGSITAEVARQLGPDISRLHGLGFCYEQQEPAHIMATAMHCGIGRNMLFSGNIYPDSETQAACEIATTGYLQEHANGMSHQPFYEYCRSEGIGTLFSGFGGDEGVTYPGGMPARLELFDRRDWRNLWNILPGSVPIRAGRFVKVAWRSGHMPTHHSQFLAAWRERWPHRIVSDAVVEEFGLEAEYFDTATYDERFRSVNDAVLYLLGRPYLPTRLENCSSAAAAYGIEYKWPLLDRRLIQQWLSTPTVWKTGATSIGRYLHRAAVDGVCSPEVAWKQSKDMGMSANMALHAQADNSALFKEVLNMLDDLPSALRDLLDVPRLRVSAETGLLENWRGEEIRACWKTNIDRLIRVRQMLQ
jgi:asparagine synthase (glutamine-hydrolysing)